MQAPRLSVGWPRRALVTSHGETWGTDISLSTTEIRDLRRVAGILIPASEEFGVPGSDDLLIFDDILRSIGADLENVRTALTELAALAGGRFADLDTAQAEFLATTYYARGGGAAETLGRVILQCYYRDDRVLRSLGHEPQPPFPRGHTLEQGDWSLLDAVRGRPQLWRDDRSIQHDQKRGR